ncbi:MAG: phosphoribosyltransferase [Deltaproteobacteria bacterium]|nr:phosphoribosyltransferase [Deltaproteobacteria bacterium]
MRFRDRVHAGQLLAERLSGYRGRDDVLVLALPRGGVPVGIEVAKAIVAPLDVVVIRKLGLPGQEELAMGAIAWGGVKVVNQDVVRALDIPSHVVDAVASAEKEELARREKLYRGDLPFPPVQGRSVIVVDDGVATGSTMLAAVSAVRHMVPARVIVAVPVAPPSTLRKLEEAADEVACILTPEPFFAVGQWYEDFSQVTDEEVRQALHASRRDREARMAEAPVPP